MQLEILIPCSPLHPLLTHLSPQGSDMVLSANLLSAQQNQYFLDTQVTHQEILLAVDLPVDVVERFPSQPSPWKEDN